MKFKIQNSKFKILFMGTPEFGAIILEGLVKQVPDLGYEISAVITEPDKPVGRKQILTPLATKVIAKKYNIPVLTPPPIKAMAERYDIPVFQSEAALDVKSEILKLKPELIVVAAYGKIIPKEILEIPKYGCLNCHPSLLPKYRGPSPIQTAILQGDEETGVSIYLMDAEVDHGPIISQRKTKIGSNESFKLLHDRLAQIGTELLIDTIPDWIRGEIKLQPQEEKFASYTRILTKEDGKIDWRKSAEEIKRQVRAFEVWPGTFTFWQLVKGTLARIKILKARIFKSPQDKTYPIGKVVVVPQNEIGVQCGKDFLVIERLHLEGGKEMNSEEFLRGHPDFIGTILK